MRHLLDEQLTERDGEHHDEQRQGAHHQAGRDALGACAWPAGRTAGSMAIDANHAISRREDDGAAVADDEPEDEDDRDERDDHEPDAPDVRGVESNGRVPRGWLH